MTVERHLVLRQKVLMPSAEWQPAGEGWLVLQIAGGPGYWLQNSLPVRSLMVGDILVMGRSGAGLLRASQLGPLKLQFFIVLPRLLSGILTVGEGDLLQATAKTAPPPLLSFSAADALGVKFAALAAQAGDQFAHRCACLQWWSESMAGPLAETPAPPPGTDDLRARFRQLVGQIPETELASHSLAGLAAQLHCSERHFSRLFREEFGISLRARQIELRLERARQLLTDSNAKIINVAYESGYHHLGLFNAMFKKRFEVTPSEWRRQNLSKRAPAGSRSIQPRSRLVAHLALALLVFSLVAGTELLN
jgi:AraC-like DNA-binding protein